MLLHDHLCLHRLGYRIFPQATYLFCRALQERFGDIPTFATLQGKRLHFEGKQRPFKRCLAFQASQSRHAALSQGRISPSDVPEVTASAWSNNHYLDKVKVSFLRAVILHVCTMMNAKWVLNGVVLRRTTWLTLKSSFHLGQWIAWTAYPIRRKQRQPNEGTFKACNDFLMSHQILSKPIVSCSLTTSCVSSFANPIDAIDLCSC